MMVGIKAGHRSSLRQVPGKCLLSILARARWLPCTKDSTFCTLAGRNAAVSLFFDLVGSTEQKNLDVKPYGNRYVVPILLRWQGPPDPLPLKGGPIRLVGPVRLVGPGPMGRFGFYGMVHLLLW